MAGVVALGRQVVEPLALTSPRYGLLSVAEMPVTPESHWEAGIIWQPPACDPADATVGKCTSAGTVLAIDAKAPTTTGIASYGADPFTVYAWIDCAVPGNPEGEIAGRTRDALTSGEGRAVEETFWTGETQTPGVFINPHLAADAEIVEGDRPGIQTQSAASPVTTGAPVDVVEAVGALEGALAACYPGEGVLHVPAAAVAHLFAHTLIVRDGERLRTQLGTRVAAYASGNTLGPDGTAAPAGQVWFYATGAVTIRRSGIREVSRERDAVDRATNSYVYIAERTYIVAWDCCHFAAQVSLGGVTTGSAGAAT